MPPNLSYKLKNISEKSKQVSVGDGGSGLQRESFYNFTKAREVLIRGVHCLAQVFVFLSRALGRKYEV